MFYFCDFTGSYHQKGAIGLADSWEQLKKACGQCAKCPLGDTRRNLVFGVGNEQARVMLIGEGPGEQEDLQGVPFVGPAGKLLDDMLEMIDLDRSKVYIANIVKCRPPRNRDPQPEEKSACSPWLRRQIALVDPAIIVCLGRIAASELIRENFRITREHGLWYTVNGRAVTALYHPSALLRDVSKRPETFADLRGLRQQIRAVCPEVYGDA
ncbi:MAG: uracil-DNA glycosylase [Oscillospiraceae bacterium]|nr:uracil-DNA glycosylase [Oscillospiraceae bacterium]